jgi:hypothetical protein
MTSQGLPVGIVLGLISVMALTSACGTDGQGEEEAEPPVYVEPGPPVRDSMSAATLEGIDPEEMGLALPWTTGEMNRRAAAGAPTLGVEGIELVEGAGFDRLIVTFGGGAMEFPGYHLGYLDGEPADCAASSDEVSIDTEGNAFLELRLTGAQGHDEAGRSTVGERTLRGGSSHMNALRRTCDFEGMVSWVWDLSQPTPYRIMELNEPARLVIDVQHPSPQPSG